MLSFCQFVIMWALTNPTWMVCPLPMVLLVTGSIFGVSFLLSLNIQALFLHQFQLPLLKLNGKLATQNSPNPIDPTHIGEHDPKWPFLHDFDSLFIVLFLPGLARLSSLVFTSCPPVWAIQCVVYPHQLDCYGFQVNVVSSLLMAAPTH